MQSSRKRRSDQISGSDPSAEEESANRAVRRSPRLEKKQAAAAGAPLSAAPSSSVPLAVAPVVEPAVAATNAVVEPAAAAPSAVVEPAAAATNAVVEPAAAATNAGVELARVPKEDVKVLVAAAEEGSPVAVAGKCVESSVEAPTTPEDAPEPAVKSPEPEGAEEDTEKASCSAATTTNASNPSVESAAAASLFGSATGNLSPEARFASLFGGGGSSVAVSSTPFGQARVEDVESRGEAYSGGGLAKTEVALPGLFPGEEDEELVDSQGNCELLKAQKLKSAGSEGEVLKFCSVGSGVARLLKDKRDGSKGRVVFRVGGTWNVLLNSPWEFVNRVEKVDSQRGNSLKFTAYDYCQALLTPGVRISAFLINFAKKDDRDHFAEALAGVK